ncbi:MAG TPA: hypothetical protein VN922_11130, partial [Bacteroidia bacterium]|nr:hypothetical protein [Bacteroidia bacterium]
MKNKNLLLLFAIVLAGATLATGIYGFAKHTNPAPPKPKPLPDLVFPKGSTYDKEWKKVDSLCNNGLSKSALKQVEMIYTKA